MDPKKQTFRNIFLSHNRVASVPTSVGPVLISDFSSSHIYFPVLGSASNIILSKRSWLRWHWKVSTISINGKKPGILWCLLISCHILSSCHPTFFWSACSSLFRRCRISKQVWRKPRDKQQHLESSRKASTHWTQLCGLMDDSHCVSNCLI